MLSGRFGRRRRRAPPTLRSLLAPGWHCQDPTAEPPARQLTARDWRRRRQSVPHQRCEGDVLWPMPSASRTPLRFPASTASPWHRASLPPPVLTPLREFCSSWQCSLQGKKSVARSWLRRQAEIDLLAQLPGNGRSVGVLNDTGVPGRRDSPLNVRAGWPLACGALREEPCFLDDDGRPNRRRLQRVSLGLPPTHSSTGP